MVARVVEVYSKSQCVQCTATTKHLDRNETPYVHKDATTEESLSFISGLDAGYRAAPVVVVFEDGVIVDHWSGYNPDAINTLVI